MSFEKFRCTVSVPPKGSDAAKETDFVFALSRGDGKKGGLHMSEAQLTGILNQLNTYELIKPNTHGKFPMEPFLGTYKFDKLDDVHGCIQKLKALGVLNMDDARKSLQVVEQLKKEHPQKPGLKHNGL